MWLPMLSRLSLVKSFSLNCFKNQRTGASHPQPLILGRKDTKGSHKFKVGKYNLASSPLPLHLTLRWLMVITSFHNLSVFILGALRGKLHLVSNTYVTKQQEWKQQNGIVHVIRTDAFISSSCNDRINDSMKVEGPHWTFLS